LQEGGRLVLGLLQGGEHLPLTLLVRLHLSGERGCLLPQVGQHTQGLLGVSGGLGRPPPRPGSVVGQLRPVSAQFEDPLDRRVLHVHDDAQLLHPHGERVGVIGATQDLQHHRPPGRAGRPVFERLDELGRQGRFLGQQLHLGLVERVDGPLVILPRDLLLRLGLLQRGLGQRDLPFRSDQLPSCILESDAELGEFDLGRIDPGLDLTEIALDAGRLVLGVTQFALDLAAGTGLRSRGRRDPIASTTTTTRAARRRRLPDRANRTARLSSRNFG
jgi:hypothetical protein